MKFNTNRNILLLKIKVNDKFLSTLREGQQTRSTTKNENVIKGGREKELHN